MLRRHACPGLDPLAESRGAAIALVAPILAGVSSPWAVWITAGSVGATALAVSSVLMAGLYLHVVWWLGDREDELRRRFGRRLPAAAGPDLALAVCMGLAGSMLAPGLSAVTLVDRVGLPRAAGLVKSYDPGAFGPAAAINLSAAIPSRTVLLSRLWGLELDHAPIAAKLGADVPVCLASRPARMGGVKASRLGLASRLRGSVLVNPGVPVATADVFRARRGPFWQPAGSAGGRTAAMAADLALLRNDLEAPAVDLCPGIGEVLARLRGAPDCLLDALSGSGATCSAVRKFRARGRRPGFDRPARLVELERPFAEPETAQLGASRRSFGLSMTVGGAGDVNHRSQHDHTGNLVGSPSFAGS